MSGALASTSYECQVQANAAATTTKELAFLVSCKPSPQANSLTPSPHPKTQILITMASLHYLPPVKPSAIALGTAFNHALILGSGIQAYGVGALINATGTLTYKGAAYLGSLIFFASAAPSVVTEKRPMDTIAVGAVARVLETVGLSLFLTYWGTRTNPFD
ncbi:unnamed protein product [Alternaria alternata]